MTWAFAFEVAVYFAYLDEFGHEGPYVSRLHAMHKTSPIFGLGGIVLPEESVRPFATFFFELKKHLLDFEIKLSGKPAYLWEKKGSALFTTKNVTKYRELRRAAIRILHRISAQGGMVFYVGVEKTRLPQNHDSVRLYRYVLTESIKRLDQFCAARHSKFLLMLDEKTDGHGNKFRGQIVAQASHDMYVNHRKSLIEPPFQAESHLYQTLQCADWICGLVGRWGTFRVKPSEYPDYGWAKTFFEVPLRQISPISGIGRER